MDTEETGIPDNKNTRGIERLCHLVAAKYLSVPRAYGVCGFAISLGEVGEEGMIGKDEDQKIGIG